MEHLAYLVQGGVMLAIIGVYVWSYKVAQDVNKKIADVYRIVNKHTGDSNIHTDKDDFVDQKVCNVIHSNIMETLTEMKADLKEIKNRT
jgi:hypothetical protein